MTDAKAAAPDCSAADGLACGGTMVGSPAQERSSPARRQAQPQSADADDAGRETGPLRGLVGALRESGGRCAWCGAEVSPESRFGLEARRGDDAPLGAGIRQRADSLIRQESSGVSLPAAGRAIELHDAGAFQDRPNAGACRDALRVFKLVPSG